jgi:hypothetical protein
LTKQYWDGAGWSNLGEARHYPDTLSVVEAKAAFNLTDCEIVLMFHPNSSSEYDVILPL